MGFNDLLKKLFGNKSQRDLKEIEPYIQKIKAISPELEKLSNDELRHRIDVVKQHIQDSVADDRKRIAELKEHVETLDYDKRESTWEEIDKIEKEILKKIEDVLDESLPEVFAVMKETARRFSQNETVEVTANDFDRSLAVDHDFIHIEGDKAIYANHWMAGGNEVVWDMVHYDVQLIGGVVLHKGKIAEMATGEGKTLVATLPVFLNALSGNGVHVVTVNDYLSKRDSEWMGPLYMFHGLSVDCIDKHEPNSEARRNAYNADITFGTNNEFGFDYLRDNMASSPLDLVQRMHNYAIVDEVDSVLIDDARTPLIISGPTPKGDDQMFELFQPKVEELVKMQRNLVTKLLAEAKIKIASDDKKTREEGAVLLYRCFKGLPKNGALIKYLSEPGIKPLLLETEAIYMADNNRRMPEITDDLYFVIDEKNNGIDMTDKGLDVMTGKSDDPNFFVLPNISELLSDLENQGLSPEEKQAKKDGILQDYAIKAERVHTVNQLLKAYTLFELNDQYVVIDNKVKIVDEQTGRIMEGRRYSDGLHQALEAKENVTIAAENQTLASITFQNYFRMYDKLAGMTGTADTEAVEFHQIYNLEVVSIPPNKPMQRKDYPDLIYRTRKEKYDAIIEAIRELYEKGQPVLVGTVSVEKSETLAKMLQKYTRDFNVLNAKNHEREAEIVAQAGKKGAVTIATNMAGRGTDIMLGGNAEYLAKARMRKEGMDEALINEATGFAETDNEDILNARETYIKYNAEYKAAIKDEAEEVRQAGGLFILGTERHESRRIDNQLRGRAGRQGDPGESRFFISLEDDLMRKFGGERVQSVMQTLGIEDDVPIENAFLTKTIESSQRKVEGRNFSIRKNVLDFDDVMSQQRMTIYSQRAKVLDGEDVSDYVKNMIKETIEENVKTYCSDDYPENWNLIGLREHFANMLTKEDDFNYTTDDLNTIDRKDIVKLLQERADALYAEREEMFGTENMREIERICLLKVVDTKWMDHIDAMEELKRGIYLRSYAQRDPVVEYRIEGFAMFDEMIAAIREDTARLVLTVKVRIEEPLQREQVMKPDAENAGSHTTVKKSASEKVGRNDPCPCGSGKKYKKCCGKDE